jgi:hypothetical protein
MLMGCVAVTVAAAQPPGRPPVADSAKSTTPAAAAQPPASRRPTPDSAAIRAAQDSAIEARSDSLRRAYLADTIRAPIARFPTARVTDPLERWRYDRRALLATGALTLADLLDRIPGTTTFRSAWAAGFHVATFHGDPRKVRLFVDGVELDAIEARQGGVLDLTDVALWTLDEVVVERTAGELRVWLRTWTVTGITPWSRADIFTGDLNTNAFRGMLGRRWRNGMSLQLGGQQVATQTGRITAFGTEGGGRKRGDGTVQGFMGRVGWARGRLSVDALALQTGRDRDAHTARKGFTDLPSYKGARRDGYLRLGYGDTSTGLWAQALVAAARTRLEGLADTVRRPQADTGAAASTDSVRGRTQQLVAVGYRQPQWQVAFVHRARPVEGRTLQAPAARAEAWGARWGVGSHVEWSGADSTRRADLSARLTPLSWMVLGVALHQRRPGAATGRPGTTVRRADVLVRHRGVWLGGGVVQAEPDAAGGLAILSADPAVLEAPSTTGLLFSAQGRLYKDLQLEVQGTRWGTPQYGRSRTQVRAELALVSDWRSRFPKGEFSVNARLAYDLRDPVPFYYGQSGGEAVTRVTERAQVVTGLLELRLQRGTLFYQYRNLTGGDYEQIPGITMPPAVQMYGIRWEFWN